MTSVSRKTARKQLASLLTTALVGPGLLAEAVFDYQVGDFQGKTPVVVVTSASSERQRKGFGGCWETAALLHIHVFVLYSDDTGAWTESDAEDRLDAIEAVVADVLLANGSTNVWNHLGYEMPTETDGIEIGGIEYRHEVITVRAQILGD